MELSTFIQIVLSRTKFKGSKLGIFEEVQAGMLFGYGRKKEVLERFENLFFKVLAKVWPVFGQIMFEVSWPEQF